MGLDEVRLHLRHVNGAEDAIIAEIGGEQGSLLVVDHFFADAVAEGLGGTAFDLTLGHDGVDDAAGIDG